MSTLTSLPMSKWKRTLKKQSSEEDSVPEITRSHFISKRPRSLLVVPFLTEM